jgi:branched-chain amino acid transport system permease protein
LIFREILIYGAVQSGVYALLAVGFSLIFGVARVINLSHGAFYMLGAYATYALYAHFHVPLVISILGGTALVFIIAAMMDRWVVKRVRDSMIKVLMITLALSLFFEQVIFKIFGPEHRDIPGLVSGKVTLWGVDIAGQRLLALGISFMVILILWLIITRTKLGNALLATAQDPEAAQLMGINTQRIFTLTMGISAILAALAGAIVASFITVDPEMGLLPMIKAFTIVILGGLGSVGGSIIAAILIGYMETLVAYLISFNVTELVPLVVIFLVLILRPSGLFGKRFEF